MSEAGKSSPGGAEFAEFKKELEATKGVKFFLRVEDVPPVEGGVKRLAIISAREYHYHQICTHQMNDFYQRLCASNSAQMTLFFQYVGNRYIGQSQPFRQLPWHRMPCNLLGKARCSICL